MTVTKKEEPAKTEESEAREIAPFAVRFGRMSKLVREMAPEVLKYDSEIDNINYVYADTSQYRVLLGKCCDMTGIGLRLFYEPSPLQIQTDAKGVMIFISQLTMQATFFDVADADCDAVVETQAVGLGISRGSGYAVSSAQTNAMRNLITNQFLLRTNDRDDDVKQNSGSEAVSFLTSEAKGKVRDNLLEKTKSLSQYATLQYGAMLYKRLNDVLSKDIDDELRKKLTTFMENKYEDGKPKPCEEDSSVWCVKKTAATKIMGELDAI